MATPHTKKRRYSEVEDLAARLSRETPRGDLPKSGSVLKITPDLAKDWLRRNKSNRKPRPNLVGFLTREIVEGRWKLNGQTISFDKSGRLCDGQHRLLACIMAEKPIASFVLTEIEDDAFTTIDTGRTRQAPDILSLHNFPAVAALAAAARWHIAYTTNSIGVKTRTGGGSKIQVSNDEILSVVQSNPLLVKCAEQSEKDRRVRHLIKSPSLDIFVRWKLLSIDVELGHRFIDGLATGEALSTDSPIYILREKMISELGAARQAPMAYRLAWIIKAWNAFLNGGEIKRLQFQPERGEAFPQFNSPGEDESKPAATLLREPRRRRNDVTVDAHA